MHQGSPKYRGIEGVCHAGMRQLIVTPAGLIRLFGRRSQTTNTRRSPAQASIAVPNGTRCGLPPHSHIAGNIYTSKLDVTAVSGRSRRNIAGGAGLLPGLDGRAAIAALQDRHYGPRDAITTSEHGTKCQCGFLAASSNTLHAKVTSRSAVSV